MELIILGHIIGDFYVQTDKIAEKKKNSIKHMILHCLIYSIIVGICFFILNQSLGNTFVISIVIGRKNVRPQTKEYHSVRSAGQDRKSVV